MFYFTPLPGFFSPFPHGTNLYRSPSSIQPYGVVPTHSYEVSRASHYSGYCLPNLLLLQDFHLLWFAFPDDSFSSYQQISQSVTLMLQATSVQALPISLATTLGIEFSFFSCRYMRCFSSLRSLPIHYFTHVWISQFLPNLSSLIRISMGQRIFAPYHGFSQLITSFFGSWCLGILPTLFVA